MYTNPLMQGPQPLPNARVVTPPTIMRNPILGPTFIAVLDEAFRLLCHKPFPPGHFSPNSVGMPAGTPNPRAVCLYEEILVNLGLTDAYSRKVLETYAFFECVCEALRLSRYLGAGTKVIKVNKHITNEWAQYSNGTLLRDTGGRLIPVGFDHEIRPSFYVAGYGPLPTVGIVQAGFARGAFLEVKRDLHEAQGKGMFVEEVFFREQEAVALAYRNRFNIQLAY